MRYGDDDPESRVDLRSLPGRSAVTSSGVRSEMRRTPDSCPACGSVEVAIDFTRRVGDRTGTPEWRAFCADCRYKWDTDANPA